jgi:heme/copper-type cytochrome/quinol oxidase subunit 3
MIRPVFTELVLFLLPFAAYAIFLVAARKGVLDLASWPLARLSWLAIAALVLMIGSFVVFATFSGVPPGSTYIPAHTDESGAFVPGQTLPRPK